MSRKNAQRELLTEAEAADLLRRMRHTLTNWRYYGKGPAYIQMSKRRVLYLRADIDAWLNARRVQP